MLPGLIVLSLLVAAIRERNVLYSLQAESMKQTRTALEADSPIGAPFLTKWESSRPAAATRDFV